MDKDFLTLEKKFIQLQNEIESNYTPPGVLRFGFENKDIRTNIFNYDNPIIQKNVNGGDFRIIPGLIETIGHKIKTYLLYRNGKLIGKFYSVNDAKEFMDN